jgi:hypothetical protein
LSLTDIAAAETSSTIQGKMSSKSLGVVKNQLAESSQPSLTHSGSSVSRPSSNYNSRPQQIIGPQKGNLRFFCLDLCLTLGGGGGVLPEEIKRSDGFL